MHCDAKIADMWDDAGAISANYNTLEHVIAEEGLITLVVDEQNEEMQQLAKDV